MAHILLATDSDAVADEVFAALAGDGVTVSWVRKGTDVRPAVAELTPDLVVLDMQIGNMGGVAASIDLHHESGAGRLPATKVLMLLDRDVDRWIADEGQADAQMVKPISALRLRKTANSLLESAAV